MQRQRLSRGDNVKGKSIQSILSTLKKVCKVDFDDPRGTELKEFMILWNNVALSSDRGALNDKLRIVKIIDSFLKDYTKKDTLSTSSKNRREIWLGQLLNLY